MAFDRYRFGRSLTAVGGGVLAIGAFLLIIKFVVMLGFVYGWAIFLAGIVMTAVGTLFRGGFR